MKARFAVCVDNSDYQDVGRDGDLRIIDESWEDFIYPGEYFLAIDLPQETERGLMESFDRT